MFKLSRNQKLVIMLAMLFTAIVAYMTGSTPPPSTEEELRRPRPVAVDMIAYSIDLKRLGTVSRVVTNAAGVATAIQITSQGLLTHGVREVPSDKYSVRSAFVVVKMKRPQFRELSRIDKKRR